jgi:hypothetical protein
VKSRAGSRTTEWRELAIPDGQPPVLVQRLFVDPITAGVTTLVRFPPGWRRPVTGYYVVEEEALFLEGSFHMSGLDYPGVTYAFFPAGYGRDDSVASDGMLAIASFGGRAEWRRGSAATDSAGMVRIAEWQKMSDTDLVEMSGSRGRLLRRHAAGSTWILERAPSGHAPAGTVVELFSLADHTWARISAGTAMPAFAGPVYCRLRTT